MERDYTIEELIDWLENLGYSSAPGYEKVKLIVKMLESYRDFYTKPNEKPLTNNVLQMRDIFALAAMKKLIFNGKQQSLGSPSRIADLAYQCADAMLAERSRQK